MPGDYYSILEIEPESTTEQIKKAYRKKARKLHPDANPEMAPAAFAELQEAFSILMDPQKRLKYNLSRKTAPKEKRPKKVENNTIFYGFCQTKELNLPAYKNYYQEFREEWAANNFQSHKEPVVICDTEIKRPELKKALIRIRKKSNKEILQNYDFIIGSLADLAETRSEAIKNIQELLLHGTICLIKEDITLWPDDSLEEYCTFYTIICQSFKPEIKIKTEESPEAELSDKNISRLEILQIMHSAINKGAGNGDLIVLFREILPFRLTIKIAETLRTINP